MTNVDGMTMTGGSDFIYDGVIRNPVSWLYAALRWSVNYTMDFKEWKQYRNKQGDVHVKIIFYIFIVFLGFVSSL